jgi:NADPH:quinone reductase-like Zn-dependent oxidoreductase
VVRRGGTVVTVGGVPDAKFARAWGLNRLLQLVFAWMTRRVTRAARARDARFEYLFMRASGEQLAAIGALVDAGKIRPIIDRTYPLAQAKEALAYVEAGRAVGKVVLDLDGGTRGS